MAFCVGLLQDGWLVWWLPCRQCSGRVCGTVAFWISWINNHCDFVKAAPWLCGCCLVGSCWAWMNVITTDWLFRQMCSSYGQWQERSTGRGWAMPCLLNPCHPRGGMRCCLRSPTDCWLQHLGSIVGKSDHFLEQFWYLPLGTYADHFWRHSAGLGGLFLLLLLRFSFTYELPLRFLSVPIDFIRRWSD